MNGRQRELTPGENKALGIVQMFEKATDARQLTITVVGNKAAAEKIHDLEIFQKRCRTLKIDYDGKADRYSFTFSLTEFKKYMYYALEMTGMKLQIDGSLKTFDNLVISNEYLQ